MFTQRTYRHADLRLPTEGALGLGTTTSLVWDLQELSEMVPSDHIGYERLGILIRITAVGGTSPTLAVALQVSDDGTNWEALTDSLTGLNTAGVRTALVTNMYPSRFIRLRFTVAGTTPSFTFQARVKVTL